MQNGTIIIDDGDYTSPNPGGGGGYDGMPTDFNFDTASIVGIAVVAIIGIILFLYFYNKWSKGKLLKMMKQHFSIAAFLEDTTITRLGKYNQMFIVILIGIVGIMFAPPVLMNSLTTNVIIRGIGALAGWGMGALLLWNYYILIQKEELDKNSNALWLDTEVHVPGQNSKRRLWRRVERESEVVLNPKQISQCMTQVRGLVELVPSVKKKVEEMAKPIYEQVPITRGKNKGQMKDGTKIIKKGIDIFELIEKRLAEAHAYRCTIDDTWPVLLIFNTTWEDAIRMRKEEMFDETTDVNILRSRADVYYMQETKMQYDNVDDEGKPIKEDLATGVFIITLNDKDAELSIVTGGYNSPSSLFSLIGEIKHLFQQNTVTAESYNRKVAEVTRLQKELDKERNSKETSGQDEFNVLQRGWKRLFNPMSIQDSLGYIVLTAVMTLFITYWLLTGVMGYAPPPENEATRMIFDMYSHALAILGGHN